MNPVRSFKGGPRDKVFRTDLELFPRWAYIGKLAWVTHEGKRRRVEPLKIMEPIERDELEKNDG